MTSYTATFRTDADYAEHEFDADTPEQALALARAFCHDNIEDLCFEEYGGGFPVEEIAISSPDDDDLATWRSDDMRLRLAARPLFEAAQCAERELRSLLGADGQSEALRLLAIALAEARPAHPEG